MGNRNRNTNIKK